MSKSRVELALCERIDELKEKLEAEEGRANEAEAEVERMKESDDDGRNTWAQPRDWEARDLPVPRLEMYWSRDSDDGYNRRCLYVLVYRHFLGGCGGKPKITANPMGSTRVSGTSDGFIGFKGLIDTPFRDGAHAKSDAKQLGLPLYITTCDGDVDVIGGERTQVAVRRNKS